MANTKTWPDPDSQIAQQGRKDVMGVYMIDPITQKATVPGTVSNQRVNAQAGDFVDGAIVTLGTEADAAITNPANSGTLMAFIKGVLTQLGFGQKTKANSLSMTFASDQGTLATLDTNSAAIKTDLDSINTNTTGVATAANQATANTSLASVVNNTANNTNIGASGDAAVVGDNAGSLSAKLRGLTKMINDIWDSVNHLFHTNIKQWNGAVPSVTNPVITEDQIRAWIIAGQGYQASTGKLTAAATTQAFSVFAPNTLTKSILIYSLKIGYSNASTMHDVRVVTADPAFANSATISNSKQGGAATNGVTSTYATTTQTASGTVFDAPETGANTPVDSFTGGQYYYIPAGTAGGLAVYFGNTAAGSLSATAKWIEI